ELTFTEKKDLDIGMSASALDDVAKRCESAGVEIAAVIAHYAQRGNLLSLDPAEREACTRCLRRSLDIAGAVGATGTLLHPGQLSGEGTYQEAWENLREALRSFGPLAEERRVSIGLENVWNKFLLSPHEAAQFVDEVNHPWVGIYLDTANMMAYGHPEQWIRALGSRIKKVHLKDFARREHAFVNLLDGDTDWPLVMSELRTVGYDDTLIHEVSGDRDALIDLGHRMRQIVAM
ncbi:MAG: sugar phosphate isomerase/epimerase family protein, partial [Candidatus Latescibacterota bacterium]|nr:sugar phosphate isomerase/epimerase family protein [Candidatus Latescibacterota bacterium]